MGSLRRLIFTFLSGLALGELPSILAMAIRTPLPYSTLPEGLHGIPPPAISSRATLNTSRARGMQTPTESNHEFEIRRSAGYSPANSRATLVTLGIFIIVAGSIFFCWFFGTTLRKRSLGKPPPRDADLYPPIYRCTSSDSTSTIGPGFGFDGLDMAESAGEKDEKSARGVWFKLSKPSPTHQTGPGFGFDGGGAAPLRKIRTTEEGLQERNMWRIKLPTLPPTLVHRRTASVPL